jgi:UDP-N-acetylglucosamine transferase subunit ALG13
MILVTVGAQMPFDRMVRAVDAWCGKKRHADVFAQIGRTALCPRHIKWVEFLPPTVFREYFQNASAIIAHAGMGSIITALELAKPILVMPRRGDLGETRNDHQVATAQHFLGLGYVSVAMDEEEMTWKLDQLDRLTTGPVIGPQASPELLVALRNFINQPAPARSGLWNVLVPRPDRKPAVTEFRRI